MAICKALSPHPASKETGTLPESSTIASPSKVITLRIKNYEQPKYLKQLNDDGILDDNEY